MTVYKTLENGVKIIEYEERFAAGLADMWNRSRLNWGGGSEIETEQGQLDYYRSGSYYNVYLAIHGEEVVGLCSLRRYYKDLDALYIHILNVTPDYMSKKIGKALILQSLERTVELGYPRLEIHTWPGNTNAVPLYKKCGFMWEDNSENTHLTCFIPTIMSQELLKPFFAEADWYTDSIRTFDVKPDGVYDRGFEFFEYAWQRSDGKRLLVTVEKFARRISRVETDDFIIELTAENHELAYGFEYGALVKAERKDGQPMEVEIVGLADGIISFEPEQNTFTIGKPKSKQDPLSKHPTVRADVVVNGLKLEMGVGINAMSPLTASFDADSGPVVEGRHLDGCITLKSSLLLDAKVELKLPENDYVHFDKSSNIVEIGSPTSKMPKTALASIHTGVTVLKPGHIKLELPCAITLSDGQRRDITVPLDIINQSLTSCFSCMTEDSYGIANGTFRLETAKADNRTLILSTLLKNLHEEEEPLFTPSKLGKPYDDEFNLKTPIETKAYQSGTDMIMELSYRSDKQAGITMTMIYTLNASGVVTRKHSLHNAGENKKSLYLNELIYTTISAMPAFRYGGRITRSQDAADDGVNSVDALLFEENWVYEDKPGLSIGVCWYRGLKPAFSFNDGIILEHELDIEAGGTVETPPVTVCLGVFNDYTAFRDYALQTGSDRIEPAEDLLEITINGSNPFVYDDELTVGVRSNRSKSYVGEMEISPWNKGLFPSNTFELERYANVPLCLDKSKAIGGWGRVKIRTSFPAYLSQRNRTVYFPSGSVDSSKDGDILTVSNDLLKFKSDPTHYPGLFSLTGQDGIQWLMSRHPKLEPYGWWSPFVGGMRVWLEKMDTNNTLKENISASFVEKKDSFENLWQGIRVEVKVSECREYKGLSYESYYLTLPGVPVLCCFTRFINRTGGTLDTHADKGIFFQAGEQGLEREVQVNHYGKSTRFVLCSEESEFETFKAEFARISSPCGSKLHWLPNFADRRSLGLVVNDAKACGAYVDLQINLRNNSELMTCPMFILLGDQDLEPEELEALKRLDFSE